ncbi:MAG: hypothetical protein NZ750_14110, partial [Anaerolineae bacterium]|nr:hypothetical protein [Anaerolineae bacterium]
DNAPLPTTPTRGSRLKPKPALPVEDAQDTPSSVDVSDSPLSRLRRSQSSPSQEPEERPRPTLGGRLAQEDRPEDIMPTTPSRLGRMSASQTPGTGGGLTLPNSSAGGRLGPRAGVKRTPSSDKPAETPNVPAAPSRPTTPNSAPPAPMPPARTLDALRRAPQSSAPGTAPSGPSRRLPVDNRPRGPRSAPPAQTSSSTPKPTDEGATVLLIIELGKGKRVEITRAMVAEYEARGFSFEEALGKIKQQFLETGSSSDET